MHWPKKISHIPKFKHTKSNYSFSYYFKNYLSIKWLVDQLNVLWQIGRRCNHCFLASTSNEKKRTADNVKKWKRAHGIWQTLSNLLPTGFPGMESDKPYHIKFNANSLSLNFSLFYFSLPQFACKYSMLYMLIAIYF